MINSSLRDKVVMEYSAAVDPALLLFAQQYRADKNAAFRRYIIGEVNDRTAQRIQELLGIDVSGYKHAITKNTINHIEDRHGLNGAANKSMANLNDVARIGYVLNHYDTLEVLRNKKGDIVYSNEYHTHENPKIPLLVYTKRINGTVYVVQAAFVNKHERLWVTTAYIENAKGILVKQTTDAADAAPRFTP